MDENARRETRNRGQFPKGRSGNPKGRPRGAKGIKTIIHEAVRRKVAMNVSGRRREVAVLEALVATMFAAALKGDRHARQECLRLCDRYGVGDLDQLVRAPLSDGEREILAGILGRIVPAEESKDG